MLAKFLALSRSTHGVLDIAMTGFAALLWLGAFPEWKVLVVALITAVAGYTALYALNDLVGVKVDREKVAGGLKAGYSVEASEHRYPLAQGKLSVRAGAAWFAGWYLVTLAGAWWLNPLLVWVVLAAAVLETIYCLLLKVSYWRVLVSGCVKALGPIAAVLVVQPHPDPALLALMVLWLFSWEIGGQNIPADWNDVEEDKRVGARTIPVVFGPKVAGVAVLVALSLTVLLSLGLSHMSQLALGWPFDVAVAAIGAVLLLRPAYRLFRRHEGRGAAALFDSASLYPPALLILITGFVVWHWLAG